MGRSTEYSPYHAMAVVSGPLFKGGPRCTSTHDQGQDLDWLKLDLDLLTALKISFDFLTPVIRERILVPVTISTRRT